MVDCQGKLWNEGCVQSYFLRFPFVCSKFVQIYFSWFVQFYCSRLFNFLLAFSTIVSLAFGTIFLLAFVILFASFFLKGVSLYFWFFSSLPFFSCEAVLSLSTVIFAMLFKCAVLCYRYAARILDYLWQLLICSCMSQFMACISSISDLYISNTSFILLMVVPCAAHAHLKVEVQNILPHYYIWI